MLLSEAVAAGWTIEAQYVGPGVVPVVGAEPVRGLGPGVAERITAMETPTGVFAVVRARTWPDETLGRARFVAVADRLADPGNLGTLLRSAEAAGVDAVVVTPGTVDVLNPKVVRASAGALFHVPVVAAELDDVRAAGLRLVGTSSHRGVAHTAADWTGRIAVVFGSEAHGLDAGTPVDGWVRIEHAGRTESLNVAMAATVLLLEASRSR